MAAIMSHDRNRKTNRRVILVSLSIWLGACLLRLDVHGADYAASPLWVTGLFCLPLLVAWPWARPYVQKADGEQVVRTESPATWHSELVTAEIIGLSALLLFLVARMWE